MRSGGGLRKLKKLRKLGIGWLADHGCAGEAQAVGFL